MKFYANPYSWDLTGFYFDSLEEYKHKLERAKQADPSGDFEHSIEDVDLDDCEQILFNIANSNLIKFFEYVEENELDSDDLTIVEWLTDNGYANDYETALEKFHDVQLCTDLQDYAFEQAEQSGLERGSFAHNYFDWEQYITDCQCNGEITAIRESCQFGNLYIVNASCL